jgi:hypothetical protein
MKTTSFAKLLLFSAVTWVVGLTFGCGLDVEIEGDPNPASVGKPLKYTIDVTFTDTGVAENGALLLLLFPGAGGLCETVDDMDAGDFAFGSTSLAAIEDRIPDELLAALPEGVTLESLASRLNGAMQATSGSQAMCEKLTDDLDELDDLENFAFELFSCLLGDIPSGDTKTVMAEFVPSKPGVLTALAIAAACEPEDPAQEGGGLGDDDDDDDDFLMCDGGSVDFIGVGCTEISVQGGFAAPAMSKVLLIALTVLLVGVGVLTRRRVRS